MAREAFCGAGKSAHLHLDCTLERTEKDNIFFPIAEQLCLNLQQKNLKVAKNRLECAVTGWRRCLTSTMKELRAGNYISP
eukprot:753625-Hanusia_phi.AAC.7